VASSRSISSGLSVCHAVATASSSGHVEQRLVDVRIWWLPVEIEGGA
jgi:hypothetical protein